MSTAVDIEYASADKVELTTRGILLDNQGRDGSFPILFNGSGRANDGSLMRIQLLQKGEGRIPKTEEGLLAP